MPIKIADSNGVLRSGMEYPTEDVSFAYLAAINKVSAWISGTGYTEGMVVSCSDSFTDKAVERLMRDGSSVMGRHQDQSNFYNASLSSGRTTADFFLYKESSGSGSYLASEAVDIVSQSCHLVKLSISGSTLKGFRNDMTTAKISATDTDLSSGEFGLHYGVGSENLQDLYAFLRAPSSLLPSAKIIIELDVAGSGDDNDPFRPNFAQLLSKHNELGNIDKYAVTWGAFELKPDSPTNVIVITGDNPYKKGAILKQIEYTKSKNLKVLKAPRDYNESVEQYRQLKHEFDHWIAGKDNYAYQTLGHADFEAMQVADTYYGNVVESYKPDAYKKVPDFEMRRTLSRWKDRLKKVKVVKYEAEKHLKKLEEVEKNGW